MNYDKQARYRARMRATGRCPHCGKPVAPWVECEERTTYRSVGRRLRVMLNRGLLIKVKDEKGRIRYKLGQAAETAGLPREHAIRNDDRRFGPRINHRYLDMQEIAASLLLEGGRMTEEELWARLATKILKMRLSADPAGTARHIRR